MSLQTSIAAWLMELQATGRVATREPATVSSVFAGQLASRLAVPDPSLGSGPAQWDYQLAPFWLRVEDNWKDLNDELIAVNATISQGADAARSAVGDIVGTGVQNVVSGATDVTGSVVNGIAAGLGVPSWALWGGIIFGAYYIVTHASETRRYVRQWAA